MLGGLAFDHSDDHEDATTVDVDDVVALVAKLACNPKEIDKAYNKDFSSLVERMRAANQQELSQIFQKLQDDAHCRKQWYLDLDCDFGFCVRS